MKNETISKATSIFPFILSLAATESYVNIILLILGTLSTLISIIYTTYTMIVKIKDKSLNNKDLETIKEEYRKELEKWQQKK